MPPEIALALSPIARPAAPVRDGKHRHRIALNLVEGRIRKETKYVSPDAVSVFRPQLRIRTKVIDCLKCLSSKGISRDGAALEVPLKRLTYFHLCVGQNFDVKAGHRALSLALDSAQETAFTVPARIAA